MSTVPQLLHVEIFKYMVMCVLREGKGLGDGKRGRGMGRLKDGSREGVCVCVGGRGSGEDRSDIGGWGSNTCP